MSDIAKKKLKPASVKADFVPSSFDEATKTIEVIATTSEPVVRWGWDGSYLEELSMEPSHVRLDRLNTGGAPFLDSHSSWDLKDVIGVVEKAWLDGDKLMALVRLSDATEDEKMIVEKVKNGILKNISIGYKIYKMEETKAESGQLPRFRATDWEPYEVSLVPIPADYMATIRSGEKSEIPSNEVEIQFLQRADENQNQPITVPTMEDKDKELAEKKAAQEREAALKAATDAERKRISDIAAAARSFGLPPEFSQKHIEDGTSIDAFRAAAQVEFAKKDPNAGASNVSVTEGEDEKKRTGAVAALVMRSAQVAEKQLSEKEKELAKEFRGLTLLDLAKDSLEKEGTNTRGMDKMEIAQRSISSSTGDFPILLEGTTRRILLANFGAAPDKWRQFCMIGSVGDFRDHKRLRMGSFTDLDKIQENGEYKTKTITDADFEKISIDTKGNLINISRKMIVNDDLNGFARLAAMLGRSAARSIENDVFALLGSNPVMQDTKTLFHADHGNLIASGAAPTVDQIESMRVLMAQQKEKDGNDFLDLRPSILLCGLSIGGTARIVNGSQYDPDAANKLQRPNKVNGLFSSVIDTPRITGTEYYAFADPNEEPVIEVAFLDGVQTPFMESEQAFKQDGISWKIRLDYGVGAIGWRGVVKNAGA